MSPKSEVAISWETIPIKSAGNSFLLWKHYYQWLRNKKTGNKLILGTGTTRASFSLGLAYQMTGFTSSCLHEKSATKPFSTTHKKTKDAESPSITATVTFHLSCHRPLNQNCYKWEKNITITIESWNFVKPRSMGTSEVTWRLIISGASKTSEYIVCKVDSFKLCSSQDKDWTNSGINCSEQRKR